MKLLNLKRERINSQIKLDNTPIRPQSAPIAQSFIEIALEGEAMARRILFVKEQS